MQASSTQAATWADFAIEALKILGPAVLTLLGSLLALRHQRLTKRYELESGTRMKAREIVFNHYQKKLDRVAEARADLANMVGEMEYHLRTSEVVDLKSFFSNFANSLITIVLTAKHEVEGVEDELKAFGLLQRYRKEVEIVQSLKTAPWEFDPQKDFSSQAEALRNILFALVLLQEALLQARMKELFEDYLPARAVAVMTSSPN